MPLKWENLFLSRGIGKVDVFKLYIAHQRVERDNLSAGVIHARCSLHVLDVWR